MGDHFFMSDHKSDHHSDHQADHQSDYDRKPEIMPVSTPTRKAHVHAAVRDWPRYYDAVDGKPARETLLMALDLFDAEKLSDEKKIAVDLGCGTGRDTFELLRRGWRVIAMDSSEDGMTRLRAQAERSLAPEVLGQLECQLMKYEDFSVPGCTLVNASFALPFCARAKFPEVWTRIVRALSLGGRFAGQLFGDRDAWAVLPDRSHQSRPEVERLLKDFVLEEMREEDKHEAGVTGEMKDWHLFHLVARKRFEA